MALSREPHPARGCAGSISGTRGGPCPQGTPESPQHCQPHSGGRRPPHCAGIPMPLPGMEPTGHFDMWRDYLGLAALMAALLRDPAGLGDPSVTLSSCGGPAPRVGNGLAPRVGSGLAPRSGPAPRSGLAPCSFCQHNGEAPGMYWSHSLRDAQGRVQCPVLRCYVCPQCGATQDWAHTRSFCPLTHRGYASVYSRPARARSTGRRQRNSSV